MPTPNPADLQGNLSALLLSLPTDPDANHLPPLNDYSDGLFRRVSIIPLQGISRTYGIHPLNQQTNEGAGCDYITHTRRARTAH
jgi:hypothetical protein